MFLVVFSQIKQLAAIRMSATTDINKKPDSIGEIEEQKLKETPYCSNSQTTDATVNFNFLDL